MTGENAKKSFARFSHFEVTAAQSIADITRQFLFPNRWPVKRLMVEMLFLFLVVNITLYHKTTPNCRSLGSKMETETR